MDLFFFGGGRGGGGMGCGMTVTILCTALSRKYLLRTAEPFVTKLLSKCVLLLRMYLWWSLPCIDLPACQVRVCIAVSVYDVFPALITSLVC